MYVKDGRVVAIGRNRTNELRNATKHAEIVAFDELRAFRRPFSRFACCGVTLSHFGSSARLL